jgi:hypothetical protein
MDGLKMRRARPGGCAFFISTFYIYHIKLEWVNWHENTVYLSLQMCGLEGMWRLWGLDKNFPEMLESAAPSRDARIVALAEPGRQRGRPATSTQREAS